ncbi:DUF6092 family protein [Streptomyces sp. NPDC020742]|uniref:DUF6092 family protein n=1 Tax=unclassified Streptomyces TaxID=2593676 RepID=UPI00340A2D98
MPQSRLHEEIALLAAYLLSSGRGLLDEPADYGAFRCTDAARRALRILEENGLVNQQLSEVRQRLDAFMFAPMGDDGPDISELLDDTCLQMAVALRDLTNSA